MSNTKTFFCHSCQAHHAISLIHKRYGASDVCEDCFKNIEQRKTRERIKRHRNAKKQNSIDDFDMTVIYLGAKDIAELTGLSIATVNNDTARGKLKCLRYKGKTFIHPDDSKEYITLKEKEAALFRGRT